MPMQPREPDRKFWRLLADYEALTRQEAVAIQHEDFPSLIEAQRLKTAIFPDWLELGTELGMSREQSPELSARLEGITSLERSSMAALGVIRESAQRRLGELAQAKSRLTLMRRNYHENEIPNAIPTGFVAHG